MTDKGERCVSLEDRAQTVTDVISESLGLNDDDERTVYACVEAGLRADRRAPKQPSGEQCMGCGGEKFYGHRGVRKCQSCGAPQPVDSGNAIRNALDGPEGLGPLLSLYEFQRAWESSLPPGGRSELDEVVAEFQLLAGKVNR